MDLEPVLPTDLDLGRRLRDEALDQLEEVRADPLRHVRGDMKILSTLRALIGGEVNADDVRRWCVRHDVETGPWMGAVFREKGWYPIGFVQSTHPGNHARPIRNWKWDPNREQG